MPTSLYCLAITMGLVVAAAVPARSSAGVSGQLVADGKPAKIVKGYAYLAPDFFDPKRKDVVVVLCDNEVPPAAVRDALSRGNLAGAGKLHCIEQTIDQSRQVINYKVQHQRLKMTEGGGSTYHVFEAAIFDGKTIAGRSRTTAPQKSFDDVPYSYDVTFNMPIAPLK